MLGRSEGSGAAERKIPIEGHGIDLHGLLLMPASAVVDEHRSRTQDSLDLPERGSKILEIADSGAPPEGFRAEPAELGDILVELRLVARDQAIRKPSRAKRRRWRVPCLALLRPRSRSAVWYRPWLLLRRAMQARQRRVS